MDKDAIDALKEQLDYFIRLSDAQSEQIKDKELQQRSQHLIKSPSIKEQKLPELEKSDRLYHNKQISYTVNRRDDWSPTVISNSFVSKFLEFHSEHHDSDPQRCVNLDLQTSRLEPEVIIRKDNPIRFHNGKHFNQTSANVSNMLNQKKRQETTIKFFFEILLKDALRSMAL